MKILKPINNNIVSALEDTGEEVVVIGRGIGFRAREGDEIPEDKIQKVFHMKSQNETERLKELFASLPDEYIRLTDEILLYAKDSLQKRLHEGAYITLADHIHFAVMRLEQGMSLQNVLHSEIKRFYPQEYAIGCYALDLIREQLGITLPDDEAASIALHIFNAEYDISVSDAFHATRLLDQILALLTAEAGIIIDTDNYYCMRFLTHLKFLTQRIVRQEYLPRTDEAFYNIIAFTYQEETEYSQKIAALVKKEHDYDMSPEEIAGLTIHIKKINI